MEYLDVLDQHGNPTGEKKLKSEIHRDGDWHRSSHMWILNSRNELLVQKRAAVKDNHPNMWDIPSAGHVVSGEDAMTSILRETEEELGLKLLESEVKYLFTVTQQAVTNDGAYINNEINDVYLTQKDIDPLSLELQAEEVAEVKFIPFLELEQWVRNEGPNFVMHPQEYDKLFTELHRRIS